MAKKDQPQPPASTPAAEKAIDMAIVCRVLEVVIPVAEEAVVTSETKIDDVILAALKLVYSKRCGPEKFGAPYAAGTTMDGILLRQGIADKMDAALDECC